MNNKHNSAKAFRKFAPTIGKTSTTFNFLSLIIAALLIISATGKAHAVCQTPQFGLPIILSVTRPVAAAAGDVNRDGTIDVAVLKSNTGGSPSVTVEIFAGNGNGVFASTGVQYAAFTSGTGYDLVTADFNNDGRLDLAATSDATLEIAVLLGNASGGFNSPIAYNADGSGAITTADFNNDGSFDIITRGFGAVSILPGQGNGTFGAAIVIALGATGYSRSIAVRDLNNDGFLDFTSALTNASVAAIRLGSGNFIFSSPPSISPTSALEAAINDFNRDGKTDVAVFRNGIWYLQRSQAGFTGISFGDGSDIPQPADYDGDGKAELAIFRPSNGYWFFLNLANNQMSLVPFGAYIDKPVAADYDGDGKTDIAVYRTGVWYLLRSQLGYAGIIFGESSDKPVPGDYDGDGKADLAVFRPSNGVWYLQRSQLGFTGIAFGLGTDEPTSADYDGDGKTDVAVFRDGTWYLQRSLQGFTGVAFGTAGDKPIPNAFVP